MIERMATYDFDGPYTVITGQYRLDDFMSPQSQFVSLPSSRYGAIAKMELTV